MDTNASKETQELKNARVKLELYLKANGFVWESRFERTGFSSETYARRPLVVKVCWEHQTEK